jgi:hypothetical protein
MHTVIQNISTRKTKNKKQNARVWISFSKQIFTRHVRKQPAKNIEMVSERGKNPRQTGEWVCFFTRQSQNLLAFGELASGYPHPC